MKNVFSIFIADVKALSKRFFAMVIVIAICFIPALYAWFNIFSNWDPYGSTKNISIAVASEDEGYTDLDGNYVNKGETVLEQLKNKDSINFVVYDNTWDALEAMESGQCYAAIIIQKHFTQNMYDLASALTSEDDSLTFYENYKLNAVANKITETAASTVTQTVQTEYLEVLFETIFGKISDVIDSEDVESTGNKVIDVITKIRDTTSGVSNIIGNFQEGSSEFADSLAGVSTGDAVTYITAAGDGAGTAQQRIESVREQYRTLAKETNENIDELKQFLDDVLNHITPYNSEYVAEMLGKISGAEKSFSTVSQTFADQATELTDEMSQINTDYTKNHYGREEYDEEYTGYGRELLEDMSSDLSSLSTIQQQSIDPAIESFFTMLSDLSGNLQPVLYSLARSVESIDPTMQAASKTVNTLGDTMEYVKSGMDSITDKLDDLLEKADSVQNSDTVNTVIDMLGGDSAKFAEFFACPVTVETEELFPVANYGTAMAPFYSTLAIWVGCVVLVAVIKVEAEPRNLKNVTTNQLYWARFIFLLILNEIQTIVIIMGDLYLLKITCHDPAGLIFAACVTSFVFVAFIYSLVISFGDIGKAIVVVIMVLEIAGSSGTYPIEILQEQFIKIYKLFPFPYAINAMREAICGYYMFDYWEYLGKLMIFAIIGFVIGLFVRHPFIKINEYIEEEMEESGVL